MPDQNISDLEQFLSDYEDLLRAWGLDETTIEQYYEQARYKLTNTYINLFTNQRFVSSGPNDIRLVTAIRVNPDVAFRHLDEFETVARWRLSKTQQEEKFARQEAEEKTREETQRLATETKRRMVEAEAYELGTNRYLEAERKAEQVSRESRIIGWQPQFDSKGNPITREGPFGAEVVQETTSANTDWTQYRKNMEENQRRIAEIMKPPPIDQTQVNKVVSNLAKEQGRGNPNLESFIQGNIGTATQKFEEQYGRARQAWWAALHPYSPYQGAVAPSNPSPILLPSTTADAMANQQQILRGAGITGDVPLGEDPLATYLGKGYDWYKEFMNQTAAQRGYQPRRYAPTARWM